MEQERKQAQAAHERAKSKQQAVLRAQELKRKQELERISKELRLAREKDEQWKAADPDRLVRRNGEAFDRFCVMASSNCANITKQQRQSIAVVGPSGVGKSTILNALAGQKVAEVGVTECTQKVSMVHAGPEYDMYDIPGNRDERADFYNIDNLHKLTSLHCIMVVYTDRFEHVLNVAKLLRSINLPHIFVRNKCNFARDGEGLERGFAKEQASANDIPLVYLGYVEKEGAVPQNIEKLKGALTVALAASDALAHAGA